MKFFVVLIVLIFLSCNYKNENPILEVLSSENSKIKTVVDNIEHHQVQILFTEIKKNADTVSFQDYSFQVNDSVYFYPASTVKLPIAILALEKMNHNKLVNRNTPFHVQGDSVITTFANEIKKIFAVSDNDAYNRLFEYLGQDYINLKLSERAINAKISHRLSVANSGETITMPLIFHNDGAIIFKTDTTVNQPIQSLKLHNTKKGNGYMLNDSLVKNPMDFSKKNYLPVKALHSIMKQLMFPELYPQEKQFKLTEEDRDFLN